MYGELTDKETVSRLEYSLENQQQDQFEVLLYKKNSKFMITCTIIYSVFVTVSLCGMFGKYIVFVFRFLLLFHHSSKQSTSKRKCSKWLCKYFANYGFFLSRYNRGFSFSALYFVFQCHIYEHMYRFWPNANANII